MATQLASHATPRHHGSEVCSKGHMPTAPSVKSTPNQMDTELGTSTQHTHTCITGIHISRGQAGRQHNQLRHGDGSNEKSSQKTKNGGENSLQALTQNDTNVLRSHKYLEVVGEGERRVHRVPLGRELSCPEVAAHRLVEAAKLPVAVAQIKHRALPRFQRLGGVG